MHLLAERALWWPKARALVVADVHWGKGDALRRGGVAVPEGSTAADLERLEQLLARYPARQMIVLGDLVHRPPRSAEQPWVRSARQWRESHADIAMRLVVGNHDLARRPEHTKASLAHLGDWELLAEGTVESGVALWHEPPVAIEVASMAGHWHPVQQLRPGARQRLRVPVFWRCGNRLVLPSFGQLTGGHPIKTHPRNQTWAVTPQSVVPLAD